MKTIILAGGFGTRLQSVVPDVPKVLAPSPDKPFLEFLLKSLYKQGFKDFVLSLGHKAEQVEAWVSNQKFPMDLKIQTVVEKEPMGTGGAIGFVIQKLKITEDVLIINGDTFIGNGLSYFLKSLTLPTVGLVQIENASRYGSVDFDSSRNIVSFREKNSTGPSWINAGVYYFPTEYLKFIINKPFSMEKELFPQLVSEKKLKCYLLDSFFIDIGIPQDYNAFCNKIDKKEIRDSWE